MVLELTRATARKGTAKMNTTSEKINKYGTPVRNYFYDKQLLTESDNEMNRHLAVEATNQAIRNILLATQHEDGQYIKKDKSAKAWLKIRKDGRFTKFFNVEFKFHFQLFLEEAVNRANEYGKCVADPEFYVVSNSSSHVVYKVILYYATQIGPVRFVNHVTFTRDRSWDIHRIQKTYPIKPLSYVNHAHNRIDFIDSEIAKLLKQRDKYVDKLGPYFDRNVRPKGVY